MRARTIDYCWRWRALRWRAAASQNRAARPRPRHRSITVVVTAAPAEQPGAARASPVPDQPTPTLEQLGSNTLPTPTLEPLVSNTIPGNGNQFDTLPFVTTANDPAAGPNNGDGIASVTFQFFGPDANLVFEQTETNAQFCAFGGGDNGQDCTSWVFSQHGNRWPNGNEATPGGYTLKVTVRGTRGQVAEEQRLITLDLDTTPTPTLEPLVSNTFPSGTEFGDDLFFQANANDPGAGPNDGDGIATVKFEIFGPNGDLVHTQTERTRSFARLAAATTGRIATTGFSSITTRPNGTPLENGGPTVLSRPSQHIQTSTRELTFTITV